ncbi:armadillo-type protein, partial [Mycena galericulata]
MAPLTRQRTPQSIHSWWSDSNPIGPTMNLNSAAKPLMKLMYHRQALGFIRKNRDIALSEEILEIYSSYLTFQHILPSTRLAVLGELEQRANNYVSGDDARTMLHSRILEDVPEVLQSPDSRMRSLTCRLLGTLCRWEPTVVLTLSTNPCIWLVDRLHDNDPEVISDALSALCRFSMSPDGAQAVVNAHVLDCVPLLLQSSIPRICQHTRNMVEHLSFCESDATASAACVQLLYLSRNKDANCVEWAVRVLCDMARRADGAQVCLDANVLSRVDELLESPDSKVRSCTCKLLRNLARHPSTAAIMCEPHTCSQLVYCLRDQASVIEEAADALGQISQWPAGAQACVDAKVLRCTDRLLHSRTGLVRVRIRRMLVHLEGLEPSPEAPSKLKVQSKHQRTDAVDLRHGVQSAL